MEAVGLPGVIITCVGCGRDVEMPMKRRTAKFCSWSCRYPGTQIDRVMNRISKRDDGCWEWRGCIRRDGYGGAWSDGWKLAHRVVYEHLVGPIPEGLTLDHLCRNPPCVNPDHLEAVSIGENILRGENLAARNARKTHCKRGHVLAGDNLHVRTCGRRACLACQKLNSLKRAHSFHD